MATSKKVDPKKAAQKKSINDTPVVKKVWKRAKKAPAQKTEPKLTSDEISEFMKLRDSLRLFPKGVFDLNNPNQQSVNPPSSLKVNAADNQDLPGGSSIYGHLCESDEAIDRILQSLSTLAKINAGLRGAEPSGGDVVRKGHPGLIGRATQVKEGILLIDKYLQHQVNELQSALG